MVAPLQTNLFASGAPAIADAPLVRRTQLDEMCWVDHSTGWLEGADSLLLEVIDSLPFHQGRRKMWDNWYLEPRLTSLAQLHDSAMPDVVHDMSAWLAKHYGLPFDQLFTNYYRSGADGVAWHSDRIGRQRVDPLVAIISLGGPRTLALRPKGGGVATRFVLESGDLCVMGGATQHGWEHGIAKVAHASPRVSLTLRRHHSRPA